jgi:phenolic acid decarboxylase
LSLIAEQLLAVVWGNPTVADKAITLAKLADVATGTVFYRKLQD